MMRLMALLGAIAVTLTSVMSLADAQAFTYQGFLRNSGTPANGSFNMTFRLYDVASGGTPLATFGPTSVPVNNGLFTVELNFPPSVWNGGTRYLEILVNATLLTPRVKISPTPYAATLRMFDSGFSNPDRMVITHSPEYTNWGLQYRDSDDTFHFLAGGVSQVRIGLGDGRVGIGTASPTTALDVAGTTRTTGFQLPTGAAAGRVLTSDASGTASWQALPSGASVWTVSGSNIYNNNTGKVGIGTTTPITRLHVFGGDWDTSATEGDFAIGDSNHRLKMGISLGGAGAGHATIAAQGGVNALSLGAGTTLTSQRTLTILGTGRVGIGTTSPSTKLHVVDTGTAVSAVSTATTGTTYGGYFASNSTAGTGVVGYVTATTGTTYGVFGQSDSIEGTGVYGRATATSGINYGVYGLSASPNGTGVFGWATATTGFTYGVIGQSASTSGTGVVGSATAITGINYGVLGESLSTEGRGVVGSATATTGITYGGYFESASGEGFGVVGSATATWGYTYGVFGRSDSPYGKGVLGRAYATTGVNYGVYGLSSSTDGRGVFGWATATTGAAWGVYGRSESTSGRAVVGIANATTGTTYGGHFENVSPYGRGVVGSATATLGNTVGVYGRCDSPDGYGVYSVGRFAATGTKAFQIDHPLQPETYYLNHFCTEAPEPLNAYSGNVVTDAQGYAVVRLPDYFESINRDFRYQLTVIGEFAQAIVSQKIRNNQFVIRTDKPFIEVSWRVEAVRNDRWVQQYGFQTEQEKEKEIQGRYLHPELYGQPKERGIHYHPEPERNETPK